MVVVKDINGMLCFSVRGKFGHSAGLGMFSLGQSLVGDVDFSKGIYRMHPLVKGRGFQLMTSYVTPNPRTISQQNNRTRFAEAVNSWQSLPLSVKNEWRKKASRRGKSGYTYYLKRYLRNMSL